MKLVYLVPSTALASVLLIASIAPSHAQSVPAVPTSTSQETVTPPPAPAAPETAAPAPPAEPDTQPQPRPRFTIGPELGVYLPTKNLVKSRFGDTWFSLGIGFGEYEVAPEGGRTEFNLGLLTNKHNGNSAYLMPLGAEYRKGLSKGQSTTPYVGAEADLVLSDIRSVTDNVKWGVRTSASGSLFGGLDLGTSARVQIEYRGFTDIAGYDFSGTNLSAGFRF